MQIFLRSRREITVLQLMTLLIAAFLSACQSASEAPAVPSVGSDPSAGSVAPSEAVTSPLATATPVGSQRPAATVAPLAITRPAEIRTDICTNGACLGLLSAGQHHTEVFSPGFEFTVPSGWMNGSAKVGVFDLVSVDAPGDTILFGNLARPKTPEGEPVPSVQSSVEQIGEWLASNSALTVGPGTEVSIGGLDGKSWDVGIAPDVENHDPQCPVRVCVIFLGGRDPATKGTWQVLLAGPERERLYLLAAKDGPLAIVVDSLDGATFDDLTKAAEEILVTVRFDAS